MERLCRTHRKYLDHIKISNEDDSERIPVSLRELVTVNVQESISHKYYGGKVVVELTEEELEVALYRSAGIEELQNHVQIFKAEYVE